MSKRKTNDIENSEYCVDNLQSNDYHKGFLKLLEQLTVVGADDISYEDFLQQYNKLKSNVFVVRNKTGDKVIGTSSILVEEKFIHSLSSVSHIEDVVVDKEYRGLGLGKLLINHCIKESKKRGCYKIILDCEEKNASFYTKVGFGIKNVQLSLYLESL